MYPISRDGSSLRQSRRTHPARIGFSHARRDAVDHHGVLAGVACDAHVRDPVLLMGDAHSHCCWSSAESRSAEDPAAKRPKGHHWRSARPAGGRPPPACIHRRVIVSPEAERRRTESGRSGPGSEKRTSAFSCASSGSARTDQRLHRDLVRYWRLPQRPTAPWIRTRLRTPGVSVHRRLGSSSNPGSARWQSRKSDGMSRPPPSPERSLPCARVWRVA
jgi:hypothetical protein